MNMLSKAANINRAQSAASQRTLIRLALEKTQMMLDVARSGNWDDIEALEKERRLVLEQCFEVAVLPDNAEVFSEALAVMLHMNEELVSLLEHAKAEAALRYSTHQKSQTAIKHYLDVES